MRNRLGDESGKEESRARSRASREEDGLVDGGSVNEELGVYALLSRWGSRLGFPKGYLGKIVLVAFVGTHAPLIAAVVYLLLALPAGQGPATGVLALLLAGSLAGFAFTVWALRALLAPVRLASSSLKGYLDSGALPELPIGFGDEAGRLMADVRYAAENMDSTVRSLEGLSDTDHLTGLPNRRRGDERLAEEAARAERGGGLITLGVVDVNRFKSINDTHGHQAGDVCIRHVAGVIARNVREGDWLARWGGDEFLLVLHDASAFASTEAVLQRITQDLKESPVRLPQGQELTLSITVGAVRWSGGADLETLFARADEAMYEAKREGRAWVLSV